MAQPEGSKSRLSRSFTRVLRTIRREINSNALWIILLLATLIRAYHVDYPYIDFHGFRQSDTANVARGFYEHGFNILYPEAAEFGQGNGAYEMEFGLVPFLVALLYMPLGVHEWVAHSVAIAFSLGTIVFVYLIALNYFSRRTALLAAFFVTVMPLSVYFGRTMMPESAMLMFTVAGVYFASRYQSMRLSRYLILSAVFISLATLVKVTSLYVLLPVAMLIVGDGGWRRLLKNPFAWVGLGIVILPSLLWYGYAHFVVLKASGLGFEIWNFRVRSATPSTLLQPSLYVIVWDRLVNLIYSPVGLALAIIGLLTPAKKQADHLLPIWISAVFIYLFGTAGRLEDHNYYLLPMVPPAAILISVGLWRVYEALGHQSSRLRLLPSWIPSIARGPIEFLRRQGPFFFSVAIVGIFVFSSYLGLASRSHEGLFAGRGDVGLYTAGRVVDYLAPPSGRVAVEFGPNHKPAIVYYGHRDTYFLRTPFDSGSLEGLRSMGATFFVSTDMDQYENNIEFMTYMRSHYRPLTDGSQYFAFDLQSPSIDSFIPPGIPSRERPFNITFGNILRLESVKSSSVAVSSGELFFLGLQWRFLAPATMDYLVGLKCWQANNLAWSWDHVLGLGQKPWSSIGGGSVIYDNLTFVVPPDAATGPCGLTLEVGWPSLLNPQYDASANVYTDRPVIVALDVMSSKLTPYDRLLSRYLTVYP